MKVYFKKNIRSYSGLNDELVYQAFRRGKLCIGRDYVYPKLTSNNHDKGAIVINLAKQFHNTNSDYKADLKSYAYLNGVENVAKNAYIPNSFPLFVKMLWAWYKSDPEHIDLSEVTLEDIVSADSDVRTIARAVEAGYLPRVSAYEDLSSGIM